MPAQLSSFFGRIGASVRGFSVAQRTVAIIGVAVLVLGATALGFWITRPSFSPLFSGLSGTDANSIVDQLTSDGVQYQLTDGGGTILVPEDDVYPERLKAAAAGLPSSTTGGYSLLDKMGVTASEFQQDVTYKRALEGELAATIQSMKGVKVASVKLAIPKETVFVSEKQDPTASVFIETRNGSTLSEDQVQAIVHLTSASVDGMKADDVSVIDSTGVVLSAPGMEGAAGGAKQSSEYETRIQSSLQQMLDRVVGPGKSSVVVAADLSQESGQRTSETYTTPDDSPAINESSSTEQSGAGGTGGTDAGILGPDNIAVPNDTAAGSGTTSQQVVRNNAINKVVESTTIPAGQVKRQTVSVAIDSAAGTGLDLADITSLVTTAAGIDESRGDQVSVQLVAFNPAGAVDAAREIAAQRKAEEADRFSSILTTTVIVLGVSLPLLIIFLVLYRRHRRRSAVPMSEREEQELAELRTILNGETVPMQLTGPDPVAALDALPPIEPGDSDRKRAEIDALAGADPQRTAEFLRGLMDDRQSV